MNIDCSTFLREDTAPAVAETYLGASRLSADGQQAGREVTRLVACLASAAATLASAETATARCEFNKIATLELNFEEGVPRTPVVINGQSGWFVFSNRSNVTAVYKDRAAELALSLYPTEFFTNNNGKPAPVYGAHISDFKVGDMPSTKADVLVADPRIAIKWQAWGALSTSLFMNNAIDFDYAEKQVKVFKEKYCAGRLTAYWDATLRPVETNKIDLAVFRAKIGGADVFVEINSSLENSGINESAVKLANLATVPGPTAPIGLEKSASSKTKVMAIIPEMNIADERFTNVKLEVLPNPHGASIPGWLIGSSRDQSSEYPKITLGVDYLMAHHVLISPIQHIAFVSPVRETVFDPAEEAAP